MQDINELLNKTASLWFFKEPALYRTFCLHELFENTKINVPFRSGQKRIEYNPYLLSEMKDTEIKKLFTREVTRCVLAHPYQRRPKPFDAEIAYLASNLVIDQPKNFLQSHGLEDRQSFEYYYYNLYEEMHQDDEDDGGDQSGPLPEFEKSNAGQPGGLGYGNNDDNNETKTKGNSESDDKIGSGEEENNETESDTGSGNDGKENDGTDSDGNTDKESDKNDNGNNGETESSDKSEVDGDADKESDKNDNRNNGDDNDGYGNDDETESSDESEIGDKSEVDGDSENGDENDIGTAGKEGDYNDATELWGYDADAIEDAKESLKNFESSINPTKDRGTKPYNLDELIAQKKERLPKYINILHLFRGAVTSSMTHLTRMRPSRRSGFLQPGKKHEPLPSILCAIDTSGSVESKAVEKMLSQVWGVFKSGVEKIDIITFDVKVNTPRPIHYKKNRRQLNIKGRGGTDFQPVINYFERSRKYDGLVVMTDGIAPKPTLKYKFTKRKTLWFIYGKKLDEKNRLELTQTGFYAFMEIDQTEEI